MKILLRVLQCILIGMVAAMSNSTSAAILTLDNGTIKVGVDTAYGGAITWLSVSGSQTNLVNDYDHGRQVQQSYYSGPDVYDPPGSIHYPDVGPWPWNPVQAGDTTSGGVRTAFLAD